MGVGGISDTGARSAGDHETDNRGVAAKGFWTAIHISRLTILWAEGYSATVIAAELGCSRNAAIGKISRLKLPPPFMKREVLKNRTYSNQLSAQVRETRRASQKLRRQRARALKREGYLKRQREAIWLAEGREETRKEFRARGTSPYSAAYRKHMPRLGEMTKGELRAMLTQAVQNTAALQ